MRAEDVVDRFAMSRLPIESVLYARTYESAARGADGTAASSAIIGLLCDRLDSRSLFHRVACDEMWHFYGGDAFRLLTLDPGGTAAEVILGADLDAGQHVQALVPSGTWQAAETVSGGDWSLFGCTVTPEFRAEVFEAGYVDDLLESWPACGDDIRRLGVPRTQPRRLVTGEL